MATMTADEIEYTRAMSGDDCQTYEVSDTLMQKFWNTNGADSCATIVEVLRVRVAKAAKLVNQSNESGQSRSSSQKYAQLRAMLSDWETRCGMSGGVLEMGTLDLRLDTDDDDTEASLWQS